MYKNLTVFTLDDATDFSNLATAIDEFKFTGIKASDMTHVGWESPVDNDKLLLSVDLASAINGNLQFEGRTIALVMRKDERIIPNSSVVELLKQGIIEFEKMNSIKPSKKQRAEMKDNVIISLMPRALLKTTRVQGYVDIYRSCIVVNTSSIAHAEEFVSLLRHTLGGLPAFPFYVDGVNEHEVFTRWVRDSSTLTFKVNLSDACKLKGEEAKAVTFKNFNLDDNETIKTHIDNGMRVSELRLSYNDKIDFTLNDKLQFKAIKQVIVVNDSDTLSDSDDATERFKADLTLDVWSHRELIGHMIDELKR